MPQVSPSSVAPEAQKRGTPRGATPTAGGPGAAAGALDELKRRVPERPRLAPGVRPAGQMQESAFVDPPWLIERQGEGYVQVPRLLYRIAELADGQRTLEDVAREIR